MGDARAVTMGRLLRERKAAGASSREVATALGVSRYVVIAYERGTRDVTPTPAFVKRYRGAIVQAGEARVARLRAKRLDKAASEE